MRAYSSALVCLSLLRGTSSGTFAVEKEAPLTQYGGTPTGYELPGAACLTPTTEKFDSRLRAGDQTIKKQSDATSDQGSSTTQTQLIKAVDATHMSSLISISDISIYPSIGSLPPTVQVQSDCTISTDPQKPFDCTVKFVNWTPPGGAQSSSKSCYVKNIDDQQMKTSGTAALGAFKTASGQVVQAQRIHRVTGNANIVCRTGDSKTETIVGKGSSTEDQIITHDFVSMEASSCPPETRAFTLTVYKLDDGTFIKADQSEIISAPQRL